MLTEIQENAIRNLINGVLKANKAGAYELGESGVLSQCVQIVSELLKKEPKEEVKEGSKNATSKSK